LREGREDGKRMERGWREGREEFTTCQKFPVAIRLLKNEHVLDNLAKCLY
jgi:hypothetical protein